MFLAFIDEKLLIILQPDYAFIEAQKRAFRKKVNSFRILTKGRDIKQRMKVLGTLITEWTNVSLFARKSIRETAVHRSR